MQRNRIVYLNSSTCILCLNRPHIGRRVGGTFTYDLYPSECETCGRYTRLVATKTFNLTLEEHIKFVAQANERNKKRFPEYETPSYEEVKEMWDNKGAVLTEK
jgi:hypothetical protein